MAVEAPEHETITVHVPPLKDALCIVRVRGSATGLLCWSSRTGRNEVVIVGGKTRRQYFAVVRDATPLLPEGMDSTDREVWIHSFFTTLTRVCAEAGIITLYVSCPRGWPQLYKRAFDETPVLADANSREAIRDTRLRTAEGEAGWSAVTYGEAKITYHVVW